MSSTARTRATRCAMGWSLDGEFDRGLLRHRRAAALAARTPATASRSTGSPPWCAAAWGWRWPAGCSTRTGRPAASHRRRGQPRGRGAAADRAALLARTVRHGRSGDLADLARPCARDAAAHLRVSKNPLTGVAIAGFPALAVVATLLMLQDRDARRDFGFLAAAAAFLTAVAGDVGAISALFLRDLARHAAGRGDGAAIVRGAAARALLPRLVAGAGADAARAIVGRHHHRACGRARRPGQFNRPGARPASQSASYAPLAQLPPGIVAADVSWGPYLLALTPHSVLAGALSSSVEGDCRGAPELRRAARRRLARILAETGSPMSWSAARTRPTASPSPSAASACGGSSAPARFRIGLSRSAIRPVRLCCVRVRPRSWRARSWRLWPTRAPACG